ncbi:hypothetical protein LX69_03389 [Breznakibacter xylanolyticus]|uniref:Uncharacterized protein n=1 Tax=Breznakibacter xylanolyticus TaxID=990 RepID=A0A2W7N0J0_9BACT|nr:hypothetical protein LX69_03389 [Breznakibacter xylanolyticus]
MNCQKQKEKQYKIVDYYMIQLTQIPVYFYNFDASCQSEMKYLPPSPLAISNSL